MVPAGTDCQYFTSSSFYKRAAVQTVCTAAFSYMHDKSDDLFLICYLPFHHVKGVRDVQKSIDFSKTGVPFFNLLHDVRL